MSDDKKSAAEEVYENLRHLILRGELTAGQNLKAAALKDQFGFGTTPLREALNRLSAEQLVINSYNQGFRVAPISLTELRDLDKTRMLLEVDMLISSVRDGDEDWEGSIVASHYQLAKQKIPSIGASAEDVDRWEMRHHKFHATLISGCTSIWMNNLLEQIETQLLRYHRNILVRATEVATNQPVITEQIDQILSKVMGISVHTPLMDATLDRNEDEARRLMTEHIRLTSDAFQAIQAFFPENAQHQDNS